MAQKGGQEEMTVKQAAGIIGGLAFAAGFIAAVACGIIPDTRDSGSVTLALLILGIIVAVLNITGKEVVPVMIAAIALIVAGTIGGIFIPLNDIYQGFGTSVMWIVWYFAVFMTPVAVISAVRAVIALARPGD